MTPIEALHNLYNAASSIWMNNATVSPAWDDLQDTLMDAREVLAQPAAERERALEEAAQVAEAQQVNKWPDYFPGQAFAATHACRTCAEAIRALKENS